MPDIQPAPETLEEKMERLAALITPAPGKVVVLVKNKDQITTAGLYIPVETARSIHEERATSGYVIAVGSDAETFEGDGTPFISCGDFILFGKYAGTQIKYHRTRQDFDTVIVMTSSSILARMEDPDAGANIKVR